MYDLPDFFSINPKIIMSNNIPEIFHFDPINFLFCFCNKISGKPFYHFSNDNKIHHGCIE